MEPGKISDKVLRRSVLKYITNKTSPDGRTAMSTTTVVMNSLLSLRIGINKVVNSVLVTGSKPVQIAADISLPINAEEHELRSIIKYIDDICNELSVVLVCGHTEVLACIEKPVISFTCVGEKQKEIFDINSVKTGTDIVMTKAIGIEGSAIITEKERESLERRFSRSFINDCMKFKKNLSVEKENSLACQLSDENGRILTSAMLNVSGGGIFAALWNASMETSMGVEVYLKHIPVWQETIELAELYDINPYMMASTGSVLLFTDNGKLLVEKMTENGIPAAVIGTFTDNNDKVVINGDEKRFLEPPRGDEIYKLYTE